MKKRVSLIFTASVILACILTGCGLFGNHAQPTIIPGGPTSGATPTEVPASTPTDIPNVSPTLTATPSSTPTVSPTEIPTETPVPTEAPTETPTETPTPTPSSTPSPTPTPFSEEECRAAVEKAVGTEYTVSAGENVVISGVKFYKFFASADGNVLSPAIVVNPGDKSLYYYYETGEISEFDEWPVDNGEIITPGSDLTADEVLKILKTIPADRLGYSGNLADCTFEIQSGVLIQGEEYFAVDMISGDRRVGIYFISRDRSSVLREDEFGDRILIK